MSLQHREIQIPVSGGTLRLAGKLWGEGGDKRALAFPGWLDNAGSFDALAPLFVEQGWTLLCIDPPGCGLSDHRSSHETYNDFDEVPMILDVLDSMGWERCVMVAHSRGGAVAATAVGSFPSRFAAFVAFDSSLGLTGLYPTQMDTTAPQRMRLSVKSSRSNRERSPRVFKTVNAAVEHSHRNTFFPKTERTARNIVRRHLTPCPGGWTFTHDVSTYGQNQNLHINEEQMREFLAGIECPTLLVGATKHKFTPPQSYIETSLVRLGHVRDLTRVTVEGRHHVHSDNAEACAAVVLPWLEQRIMGAEAEAATPAGGSVGHAIPSRL